MSKLRVKLRFKYEKEYEVDPDIVDCFQDDSISDLKQVELTQQFLSEIDLSARFSSLDIVK